MKLIGRILLQLWLGGMFTPEGFVFRALFVSVLYGISCLLGLAEYTAFLSGTSPGGDISWETASVLGLIHLLLHVAFILFVPISLITAVLLMAWERLKFRRARSNIN